MIAHPYAKKSKHVEMASLVILDRAKQKTPRVPALSQMATDCPGAALHPESFVDTPEGPVKGPPGA
eukprot:6539508-Pyramimonas_sp.AAC.1